ncbi:AI-2E family transporter [Teichococcus aestuarii]|uniref:AI-2E family transporter n=1 Tax=Teichococcus aestuarii TaxID=568898 RepID=A0A2U1UYH7_9PROT|nr:AI-2E family transporter [Pseudoroseomonas aestuarii]PWC26704.1 AI-2E family transporter [Pseudoroseomonas aestuarii]
MPRKTVSLLILAGALLLLLWMMPEVPLLVFAAALLGVFLHAGARLLRRVLPVPHGAAVGLFLLLLLLLAAGIGMLAAQPIAEQLNELWRQVPAATRRLTDMLSRYSWGQEILQRLQPGNMELPAGGSSTAFSALNTTFGALANVVLVAFLGLYFALDPKLYRRGIEALVAPSLRPRARQVCEEAAATLRGWLGAQMVSMAVVGMLTGLGLWLIGIPLALVLGLIAALLAFIPTLGPVLAAVPAVLLGLSEGFSGAFSVIGVYLVVQSVESYLITPYVQKRSVDLPEAATIIALVAFGLMFGFLGMLLATPMAALLLMLVRRLYVEDYLEHEPAEEQLVQRPVILRS